MAFINRLTPLRQLGRNHISVTTFAAMSHHNPTVVTTRFPRTFTSTSRKHKDPPVLAKPTKYNPPSHPSRPASKTTPGYGTGRSYAFPKDAPPPKDLGYYPNTLPPEGTWQRWFITNRTLHFYLSLGVLFTMAGIVSVTNFMKTSPFAGLVCWDSSTPIASTARFFDAVKMHLHESSRLAQEKRKKKALELDKRNEYRRAHGMEDVGGGMAPVAEGAADVSTEEGK